jgi:hypothetical protein
MSTDRQFAVSGKWALAADRLQWILQRRGGVDRRSGGDVWINVSFVRSTKDILARCMREKGTPAEDAQRLLADLPQTFDAWQRAPGGREAALAVEFPEVTLSPALPGDLDAPAGAPPNAEADSDA